MHQEQQRTIADSRQTGTEATIEPFLLMLLRDRFLDLLPFDAKRRIGKHVVKLLARQAIVGQRVAVDDVADVLPLDQHVGLADRVRLGVQFLAVHHQPSIRVVPLPSLGTHQMILGHRQHASGSGCRIVQRTDNAGLGQCVVVFDEQQVDHQPDDFSRREMFSGGFVGQFRELANQFFKDVPHLLVANDFGMQVDVGELFGDQIQQMGLGQSFNLRMEVEAFKDIADCWGERLNVRE